MTKEIGNSEVKDTWAANGGVTEPDQSKVDVGWSSGERPAFQFMNWFFNEIMKDMNYLKRTGIAEWNTNNTYEVNDFVQVSGVIYKALAQNTASVPPSASWSTIGAKNNLVATTNPGIDDDAGEGYEGGSRWINTTSGDAFILIDPSVGAADWQETTLTIDDLGALAVKDNIEYADLNGSIVATLIEAEAGAAGKLINADILQGVLSSFLTDIFDVDLSANGYIKFGGITIQWGTYSNTTGNGETFNFPTAFGAVPFAINFTAKEGNRSVFINDVTATAVPTATTFPARTLIMSSGGATSGTDFFMMAIGTSA